MNPNFQYSRVILKRSGISGATPTINTGSTNHTDGTWSPTDLYEGEIFLNSADDLMWVRTSNGILPISISGGSTSVTSAANIGTGEGIFESNSGGILQFKSLVAGAGITLTSGATEIEISSTGGGDISLSGNNSFQSLQTNNEFFTGGYNNSISRGDGSVALFQAEAYFSSFAWAGGYANRAYVGPLTGESVGQQGSVAMGPSYDNFKKGVNSAAAFAISNNYWIKSGNTSSGIYSGQENIVGYNQAFSSIIGGSGNTINDDLENPFGFPFSGFGFNSIINSRSSTILSGVSATTIIGGVDLTATTSNTVYVPNLNVEGEIIGAPYDLSMAISDETTAITTGNTKLTLYAPRNFSIEKVKISLSTSGSTTTTVDVNVNGSTILSSPISLTSGNFINTTTSISSADVDEDDRITIDIDVAGTDAAGLKCYLIGKNRV